MARLSIDALTSARARRESYVGPWLPEPLLTDGADPAATNELSDSLSLAFLVLLEELSPAERAAFLLHDVFGYSYPEVATALDRQQPACRQLVARARKDLAARRRRFDADRKLATQLTDRFLAACAGGDLTGLLDVLAEERGRLGRWGREGKSGSSAGARRRQSGPVPDRGGEEPA